MSKAQDSVKIISFFSVPSKDPKRVGLMDRTILYMPIDATGKQVGAGGRYQFSVVMPEEGITEQKVDAALRTDYAKQKPYIDRVVTV